ncbi:MAG: LysM peptidoglycan-binding domain-containing protein [Anaerolineales bacterium]|nr:LysM peptidoglycan-binding domain-containing protein [Anaerolineales bacterium]
MVDHRQMFCQYRMMIAVTILATTLLFGCQGQDIYASPVTLEAEQASPTEAVVLTPDPTRPVYAPGELVDYIAQAGDTLPGLAAHFNTTVEEILAANPFIPASATTMPPGMPMQIPVYYTPFWGTQYRIIPDGLFVNGPAQVGFDVAAYVSEQPGWLNGYKEYAFGDNRSGAEIVDYIALNYSVSPRLLLAMLEYQAGALSDPVLDENLQTYMMGNPDWRRPGLYLQLNWAANLLNNGYYGWRIGDLLSYEHTDGRIERPDPWQNAATVALQNYFLNLYEGDLYRLAISAQGFAAVYSKLFGDPWLDGGETSFAHIPGSLEQPSMALPFTGELVWAYTGGPHTAWGQGAPFAALDFAPGSSSGGCTPTTEWATAVAAGVVARSETATVVLDLDGDGDERTGWVVFYFHVASEGRVPVGTALQTGDPIGHPSCEGGRATGTHIHIARKYNGEWMLADGTLAFNLGGWVAENGADAYQGTLRRGNQIITACTCSDAASHITADR